MYNNHQQIFTYRTRTPNSLTTIITPVGCVSTTIAALGNAVTPSSYSKASDGLKPTFSHAKPRLGSRVHKRSDARVYRVRGAHVAASRESFPSRQPFIRQRQPPVNMPPANYGYSSGPSPPESPAPPVHNSTSYTSWYQHPQTACYGYSIGLTPPESPHYGYTSSPSPSQKYLVPQPQLNYGYTTRQSPVVSPAQSAAAVSSSVGSTDFWKMVSDTDQNSVDHEPDEIAKAPFLVNDRIPTLRNVFCKHGEIPGLDTPAMEKKPVCEEDMRLDESVDDVIVVEAEESKVPVELNEGHKEDADDDVLVEKVPVEQVTVEDDDTDDELAELRAARDERAAIDIAGVRLKQEPVDPEYDFEPIVDCVNEDNVSTTQAARVTVSSSMDGNIQMEAVPKQFGPSVPKAGIRITVLKPPPPPVIRRQPVVAVQEEGEPQFPEQPDFVVKPGLRGVRFANQPAPAQQGHDASGLCSIM